MKQAGTLRSAALLLMDATVPDVIHHNAPMPDVPGPEAALPYDFRTTGRDIRVVDGAYDPDPDRVGPPELYVWVRFRDAPAEPYLHAALLAQSTTHWTIGAAMRPPTRGLARLTRTGPCPRGVMKTTIAFHDEVDVTEWLLYENPAIYAGRGLAQGEGRVFTPRRPTRRVLHSAGDDSGVRGRHARRGTGTSTPPCDRSAAAGVVQGGLDGAKCLVRVDPDLPRQCGVPLGGREQPGPGLITLGRHDRAGAPAGLDEPGRLEFAVAARDRVDGDTEVGGKCSDGGQPSARWQRTIGRSDRPAGRVPAQTGAGVSPCPG